MSENRRYRTTYADEVKVGDLIQACHGDTGWSEVVDVCTTSDGQLGIVTGVGANGRLRWWDRAGAIRIAEEDPFVLDGPPMATDGCDDQRFDTCPIHEIGDPDCDRLRNAPDPLGMPAGTRQTLEFIAEHAAAAADHSANSPWEMLGYRDATLRAVVDLVESVLADPAAARDVHMGRHWTAVEQRLAARPGAVPTCTTPTPGAHMASSCDCEATR